MTTYVLESERDAVDRVAPLLQAEGYEVIRRPEPENLPPFLARTKPDAIAVGKKPSLLVEVYPKTGGAESRSIHELEALLKGHSDWDLRVFYCSVPGPTLDEVSDSAKREAVGVAARLSEVEPRAALLFAWSILEAVARKVAERAGSRPLNPGSLVNLLTGEGLIDQDQASEMFRLSKVRSQVAHGQLDVMPTADEVAWLLSVAEEVSEQ